MMRRGFRLIPETVGDVAWLESIGLVDDGEQKGIALKRVGRAFFAGEVEDERLRQWAQAKLPGETEAGHGET